MRTMPSSFTPVPYEFREVIAEQIAKQAEGRIFFFDDKDEVDSFDGKAISLVEIPQQGIYLNIIPEKQIRIDRIITLFGKPGAAYDEYDSFANQCLACTGGYPL
jgi:hypothetical protein